jgi:hypothetical protein
MDRKFAFLTNVLGEEGAHALSKAAARSTALEGVLLPRAVLAWVRSIDSFEGGIPGIENSYIRFAKSESGYSGSINLAEQLYEFSGASQEHVASAVIVALGQERARVDGTKALDLSRLGKSIDLLVKARRVTASLAKAAPQGARHGAAAVPQKQKDPEAPTAPTKQQAPPRPPEPKPKDYVPAAPRAKVQLPKVKLPGVKFTKTEIPHACVECGTRFRNTAGTLRGCLCIRDLMKSVDIEDSGDHYVFTFGGDLDHEEQSFIVETLGARG